MTPAQALSALWIAMTLGLAGCVSPSRETANTRCLEEVASSASYMSGGAPKCYLLEQAISRLDGFLPVLQRLVESGPSLFVALANLNLLEVAPRSDQLPYMVTAVAAWLARYADDRTFWVDQ